MDIYSVLKRDHQVVKKILKNLDETTIKSHKGRTRLLAELKLNLVPHARAEEQVYYEALKKSNVKEADDLGFEGYEEHAVADHLIKELEATRTDDLRWGALMSVLKENIEHHIQEEENNMFKTGRKSFDSKTAQKMAGTFLGLKEIFTEELTRGESLEQPPSHSI